MKFKGNFEVQSIQLLNVDTGERIPFNREINARLLPKSTDEAINVFEPVELGTFDIEFTAVTTELLLWIIGANWLWARYHRSLN